LGVAIFTALAFGAMLAGIQALQGLGQTFFRT
jgi:hypothetical protein